MNRACRAGKYPFSYTGNLADSPASTTYPSGRVVTNSYDNDGNPTQRTDANGTVTNLGPYDVQNRVSAIGYSVAGNTAATPGVCYSYDQDFRGALSSVGTLQSGSCTTSPVFANTTAYTHGALGRVHTSTQTTNGVSYPFTYGYSLTDQLTSITYPSGR